ncbi:MAG: ATP-binding protein [Desulfobacterales bacterium]
MSLRKFLELKRSLALRLTLWYAGILTVSAAMAFLLFYLSTQSVMRQQTDDNLLKRAQQFSTLMDLYGIDAVRQMAVTEAQETGQRKVFLRFLYPSGTAFSSSNMSNWQNIHVSRSAIKLLLEGRGHVFETIENPPARQRVRILYAFIGSGLILQSGQSMETETGMMIAFRRIFLAVTALLILLAVGAGWVMARQALAGVATVTRTARQIADGDLDRRVPVTDRGDEIDQLAVTFNRMIDRIQQLVANIREMTANIAHDLRSPITRLRGLAEVTLTTATSGAEFEAMAAGTIEECDRLLDMINTMLLIAKAEAGVDQPVAVAVDLAATVREACELFRPMAEDKRLRLRYEKSPPVAVRGDTGLIQRMVANLLDNALKYTPTGGTVTASVGREAGDRATFILRDTGIGISPADRPHIFERFYRGDHSRSQPGTGLGLSLARAIARAHGGDIRLGNNPPGGAVFIVSLPSER